MGHDIISDGGRAIFTRRELGRDGLPCYDRLNKCNLLPSIPVRFKHLHQHALTTMSGNVPAIYHKHVELVCFSFHVVSLLTLR
jgi:hypothetical protein